MACLDIEKAFDKVWIKGLLYKLIKLEFPKNLVKLLHSYLTERKLKVRINHTLSNERRIGAGVPQGSVLGPALFNLYLHDFPQFKQTNTALYADDTALYANSHSAQVATKQIQIHLNLLQPYYKKWKINLNSTKTEHIIFSRKYSNNKIFTQLKVGDSKIEPCTQLKYLGLHMDSRLNFIENLKQLRRKGEIALKNLYPLLIKNNYLTTKNKLHVYTAIIRPIITYAAPVWRGVSKTTLSTLQVFQNKCLRLALNKDRYTKITELQTLSGIPSIRNYIEKLSGNFYKSQTKHNPLLKKAMRHPQGKHKFTHTGASLS